MPDGFRQSLSCGCPHGGVHDLHTAINDNLTEAGIVIALPQRDLHLHSVEPLQVRVIADASSLGVRSEKKAV